MKSLFQSLDWVDVDFDNSFSSSCTVLLGFQSLDWVDVDFDLRPRCCLWHHIMFQSLDWVDVDFDLVDYVMKLDLDICFNPSTGLMLISTRYLLLSLAPRNVSIPRLG